MAVTLFKPLASVGAFVFDCELSSSTGQTREYSTRRLANGALVTDHSVLDPGGRSYNLTGRVAQIGQPQNYGRPSPTRLETDLENLVGNLARGVIGQSTRLRDAEDLLSSVIEEGDEVEVVSKKRGKFRAVVVGWQVADGPSDSGGSTYSVDLWEVQRAFSLSFINPNEIGASLNGSGETTDLGATGVTDATLDLVA